MPQKTLMVAAAGTGGHVMPGLAVAQELMQRGWQVSWIGTTTGMESGLVAGRGIAFEALDFQGLRGKGLKTALFGGFKLLASIFRARGLMARHQPAVLFSTGGYVAVPAVLAAWSRGIPVVLMNCDAGSLLSVRMVMPMAAAVLCGFEGEAARRAGDKAVVSGNPVRQQISALPAPAERYAGRTGPLNLLVFGGSLGARVLNETVPQALAAIEPENRPHVVHQCGRSAVDAVKASYAALGVQAEVVPFIDDMAGAYAWCDLVVSRAGATSVSELAAAGVPAVLVPFVARTTAHQRGNAAFMQKAGAAIHLEQADLTAPALEKILRGLSREKLVGMAEKARSVGRRDAARTAADLIEKIQGS